MTHNQNKIPTNNTPNLTSSPFSTLNIQPATPAPPPTDQGRALSPKAPSASGNSTPAQLPKSRGRADVLRTTSGRAGKTVTLIKIAPGILTQLEKEKLLKQLQQSCGCGGTLNSNGHLELQGDKRDKALPILKSHHLTPILSGG